MKIALAIICKGSDEEAKALDRCLSFNSQYVDDTFITITHTKGEERNKAVEKVCNSWEAKISDFEWVNDFSAARNFNFSQVPKEYDYILWCDADDGVRGLEKLRDTIEENSGVDMFAMNYLYDFDAYKQPTVVHIKNQVIRNDGCVKWAGALHEDFHENRQVTKLFIKGIERIHLTNDKRIADSKERNVIVSKAALDLNPNDARLQWNYGNSLMGAGKYRESRDTLLRFIELSNSEEEKYIAYTRVATISEAIGDKSAAVTYGQMAIGIKPMYPDAYHTLGQIYYNRGLFQKAADMVSQGLIKKPPYYSILVYNPRDYDFHPMMLLAKTFYSLARPDQALTCLQACKKMQPENKEVNDLLAHLTKEKVFFDKAVKTITRLEKLTDKKKLKAALARLPLDMRSHPAICVIRNKNFIKEKSSGRDLVVYASFTEMPWSPSYAKEKGVGGSEEAVLNLSKEWVKLGWNVTVYCNTGNLGEEADGVSYKPFWEWNHRDKQDVVVLWRSMKGLDHPINADKIVVDLHDVVQEGEFTPERLAKVHKIFVKTQFHRSLIPNVPDEKIAVIPNGMDFELFNQLAYPGTRYTMVPMPIEKDQYLIVNTSSPDRSLDVLPALFKRVKEQVPEARLQWAYGFDLFDKIHSDHSVMMQWSTDTKKAMEEAGIENLGRLSQSECAKLYLKGNILAYPTEFAEIDCITVKKAQACGCIPITTDFGALNESVQYGIKIHSEKTKDTWAAPNQFHFGLQSKVAQDEWVDAVVKQLKMPLTERKDMKEWAHKFEWPLIAQKWDEIFRS